MLRVQNSPLDGFPRGGRELADVGGKSPHCCSVLGYGLSWRNAKCEEGQKGLAM